MGFKLKEYGKKMPSIIHQIWSGVDGPLPEHFRVLGETWKGTIRTGSINFGITEMNEFIQEFYHSVLGYL